MAFHGDFSSYPLPDLLQWLDSSRKTGALSLSWEMSQRKVFLLSGQIIAASAPGLWERISRVVEHTGDATGDACLQSLRRARSQGFATDTAVRQIAEEELIGSLVDLTPSSGSFHWTEDSDRGEDEWIALELPLRHVLFETLRRMDEVRDVERALPHEQLVLHTTPGAKPTHALQRAIAHVVERDDDVTLSRIRLALGLLPHLHVAAPVAVSTRYRPGADATLGGDFYDAWLTPDGRLRAVIGDVCGHGPAEAAVGVALRIAWRTLTLSGTDEAETLQVMDAVLRGERDEREPFVTVCDLTLDLAAQELTMRLHGHPPPLLVAPEARWLERGSAAPPLGLLDHHVPAEPTTVALPAGWSLFLLTDGLYEGRTPTGRLGDDGLVDLVRRKVAEGSGPDLLDWFAGVAAQVDCPVGIQNAPEFLGIGLTPPELRALAERQPNITVAKAESSAAALGDLVDALGGRMTVLNGRAGLRQKPSCRTACSPT